MRVMVTGGTGRVGGEARRRLIEIGIDLLVVGRSRDMTVDGARYEQCDIDDYDRLYGLMRGCDAVVHLAAIASPEKDPGRDVFRANAQGSFNVYEAAAACGIGRVVSASSINAFGYFFGRRSFPIEYLPIDELHPVLATDAYSYSKQVLESIAGYFWLREGISGACLRLPGVRLHERTEPETLRRHWAAQREYVEEILALSPTDRHQLLARLHEQYDAYRARGGLEGVQTAAADSELSPEERGFMHSKANFWAGLDDRDSAQAIEKALLGDYEGYHTLFVNYHRNSLGLNPEDLAQLFLPPVGEVREQRAGDSCLVCIDRARQVIGFEPEHEA